MSGPRLVHEAGDAPLDGLGVDSEETNQFSGEYASESEVALVWVNGLSRTKPTDLVPRLHVCAQGSTPDI
jgi:hypothetical protein